MPDRKKEVQDCARNLFNALDKEGYDGWMCIREQEDDARITDWSFVAAKSPDQLFSLIHHLMDILYLVEEDDEEEYEEYEEEYE